MRKALARGAVVVGGAAVTLALVHAAPAGAINEYEGLTWAQAASQISQNGGRPKIASKVGSFLPDSQCVVTGSRSASFLDSSGQSAGNVVLVDLNCNYMFSLPGVPGNSKASPEGKEAYEQALEAAQQQQEQAQAEAEQAAAEEG